jgi:hypothetical protein
MGVELGSYELINFATVVVTSLSNFQNPFSIPSVLPTFLSGTENALIYGNVPFYHFVYFYPHISAAY